MKYWDKGTEDDRGGEGVVREGLSGNLAFNRDLKKEGRESGMYQAWGFQIKEALQEAPKMLHWSEWKKYFHLHL